MKTFRGPSMRAALELVKRELGSDAVILGTRSVPAGRIGRLVGGARVEITATPPDTSTRAPRLVPRAGRSGTDNTVVGVSARPRSASVPKAEQKRAVRLPPDRGALAKPAGPPALPERVYPYFVRLVQNEVAEDLAARLLRAAARTLPANLIGDERLVSRVLRRCIERMVPTAGAVRLSDGSPRRIALVGSSGGGKSTTLAKLAAHVKLRLRKEVGLLSLDMHRLGANEQMQRYADAIDVPMESAQTLAGVQEVLPRLKDVDCLLIDTPGVGPREQGRFARLAALLRAVRPDEIHLVLPACVAAAAQARIARAFAPLGVCRVVLTHLDEAVGFGVILNVMDKLEWELSYWTAGQNVPHDLEEACGRRVAELILPTG